MTKPTPSPSRKIACHLGLGVCFTIPETGEKWVTHMYKSGLGWRKITTIKNVNKPQQNPENYIGTSVLGPPDHLNRRRRWLADKFTLYKWNPSTKEYILVGPSSEWVRFYGKFDRTSRRVQKQWSFRTENGKRIYTFNEDIPSGHSRDINFVTKNKKYIVRFISPNKFIFEDNKTNWDNISTIV